MQTAATAIAVAAAACLLVLVIVLAVISPPQTPEQPRTVMCPVPQTYAQFTADEAAKLLNEFPECSYLGTPNPS